MGNLFDNMKLQLLPTLLVLSCLTLSSLSTTDNITCTLCVSTVTAIDNWITSDKTEQEIVNFVDQLCDILGLLLPNFGPACRNLIDTQLPAIIDGLVNDNMDPTEVCTSIDLCP